MINQKPVKQLPRLIVAATATHGAGKGTLGMYLARREFKHFSCRKFLYEEIDKRGLSRDRDSLNAVSNDLREKHGAEYVAFSVYERARQWKGHALIESIYTPAEIECMRKASLEAGERFSLVAIDADQRIRYDRAYRRGSETDSVTFEQFASKERREMGSVDPHKHNLIACREMADIVFDNSTTIEHFFRQLDDYFFLVPTE
jgi:dephospho-CoA kinase